MDDAGPAVVQEAPQVARLIAVSKRLGSVQALSEVSLEVEAGKVTALLGPNGAGKTTCVNLLLGLRRPDQGTVELFGADPRDRNARRHVGATPQSVSFPVTLTPAELLRFVAVHYPRALPVEDVLERLGLTTVARRQSGGLSGGQRRRLALALALIGRPRLLVLDEPTTGLDVEARRALWSEVRAFRDDGGSVLLTTHYLEEADVLADEVALLAGGRVVARGSPAEMKAAIRQGHVEFDAPAGATIDSLPGVTRSERHGGRVHLWTTDPDALVAALVRREIPFSHLTVTPASLEDAVLATLDLEGGAPDGR